MCLAGGLPVQAHLGQEAPQQPLPCSGRPPPTEQPLETATVRPREGSVPRMSQLAPVGCVLPAVDTAFNMPSMCR